KIFKFIIYVSHLNPSYNYFISFAGMPTAVILDAISFVTTAPAPIVEKLPILTLGNNEEPRPIKTPSSKVTNPPRLLHGEICEKSFKTQSCTILLYLLTITWFFITTFGSM